MMGGGSLNQKHSIFHVLLTFSLYLVPSCFHKYINVHIDISTADVMTSKPVHETV